MFLLNLKVSYYKFTNQKQVPQTSLEIYSSNEIEQSRFERYHVICQLISTKLLKFDRVLEQAKHIKLNNIKVIEEFTSEKDLASYVLISQISLRNYNEICKASENPVINNFLVQNTIVKACINSLVRNDYKNCVKNLKVILDHLSMDPLISLKIQETTRVCYTSIISMYLSVFKQIKIDSQSQDLEIPIQDIQSLVEEIHDYNIKEE